jgi:hypothetical protein
MRWLIDSGRKFEPGKKSERSWPKASAATELRPREPSAMGGAVDGDRTHDPLDHNQML